MSDIFLTPSHLTTFITPVPQDFALWRSFVEIWTFWMRRSISTYLSTLFLLAKSIRPLHLYFTIMTSQFLSLPICLKGNRSAFFSPFWVKWMNESISLTDLFLTPHHPTYPLLSLLVVPSPLEHGLVADISNLVLFDKEIDGKYVGSRPIKLRKSNWKDRNVEHVSWMVFFFLWHSLSFLV